MLWDLMVYMMHSTEFIPIEWDQNVTQGYFIHMKDCSGLRVTVKLNFSLILQ